MEKQKTLTLNLTEVAELIGVNKRTLFRMIKDKRFDVPSIRGLDPRRWNREDIDAWRFADRTVVTDK